MIAKFLPYLKAHRWPVAWALVQVFLVAGVELLKPWPLQIVIDYVLGGKTPPSGGPIGGGPLGQLLSLPAGLLLLFACVAIVIIHFSAGGLTLWHNYTTIRVGQSMVNDLRGDLYAHLQLLSLAYHSRSGSAIYSTGLPRTALPSRQWGMAAIKVVQAFTKEEEEYRWFMGASRDSLRATLRLYNGQTLYSGGVNLIIALGTAIVISSRIGCRRFGGATASSC